MAQVISEVAEMLNQLASFPGGSGAMIFLTRVYGGYHKLVRWGYIPTYNVWEPLPAMRVFFFNGDVANNWVQTPCACEFVKGKM